MFSVPEHLHPSSIQGAELCWLLTIEWDGYLYRWSSQPITVVDDDGTEHPYGGGLDAADITTALGFLSDSADAPAASFEVWWPGSVAEEIATGRDLSSARGEFAIIPVIDGEVPEWSSRELLVEGFLIEPTYGAEGDPVAFSIESRTTEDGELWPPVARGGLPYIFGSPGGVGATPIVSVTRDGSGDATYLLIAGHHVSVSHLRLHYLNATTGVWGEVSVPTFNTTSSTGDICLLDVTGYPDSVTQAESYAVEWVDNDGDRAYGIDGADGPIRSAADMLHFMLAKTPAGLSLSYFSALRERLEGIEVAGYIDEPCQPWEWVADNLLPILPISLLGSPTGARPVLWQYDATTSDAVAHLSAGPGLLVRSGPVAYTGRTDEVVNDVSVSYAWSETTQDYEAIATADVASSSWAGRSQNRYNRVGPEVVETDIVYSEATASWIALWKLAAGAFPRRVIEYDATHELAWLQLGDVVTLTDEELHLSEQVGLLTSKSWSDTGIIRLTIELLEHGD